MSNENNPIAPEVNMNDLWNEGVEEALASSNNNGEEDDSENTESSDASEAGEGTESDGDESESISEDDDGEDEGDEEEESDVDDEDEQERPQIKKYKATTADGTQVDIDSETTVKIKVNGKFVKVPFKDLTANYNGKVYYDEKIRRVSEQEKEAKALLAKEQAEVERVNRRLKNLTTEISEANVISALGDIGEMIGVDPAKFQADIITGMSNFIQTFSNLTPEGQQRFLLEQKLHRIETSNKNKTLEQQELEKKQALDSTITQVSEKYQIPIDEMRDAYQALTANYKSKGLDPSVIKLDDVVDLSLAYRVNENLKSAQEELGKKLTYEEFNKLRDVIFKQEKEGNADLDLEDYKLIIGQLGKKSGQIKASSGLSKKVATPVSKKKKDSVEIDIDNIWGI